MNTSSLPTTLVSFSGSCVTPMRASWPPRRLFHQRSSGRQPPPAENQSWASRTGVRKRGRRGGVRQRLKRQGHRRIPLPSIFLANVQSLRNKVDELQAKVKFLTFSHRPSSLERCNHCSRTKNQKSRVS